MTKQAKQGFSDDTAPERGPDTCLVKLRSGSCFATSLNLTSDKE